MRTPAIQLMNIQNKKLSLFTLGCSLVQEFLTLNNIKIPEISLKPLYYSDMRNTGIYRPNKELQHIFVNLDVTAWPVSKPGQMRWSHPGWKTDRTAYGVVAHETGHHVEYMLARAKTFKLKQWKEAAYLDKKKVTSYEPNYAEAFAESMRVFICNSELLRYGIPARYKYITEVLGLKPIIADDYKDVISNENYFKAADKWCGVGV